MAQTNQRTNGDIIHEFYHHHICFNQFDHQISLFLCFVVEISWHKPMSTCLKPPLKVNEEPHSRDHPQCLGSRTTLPRRCMPPTCMARKGHLQSRSCQASLAPRTLPSVGGMTGHESLRVVGLGCGQFWLAS